MLEPEIVAIREALMEVIRGMPEQAATARARAIYERLKAAGWRMVGD